jgi:ATP-dependent RNA helicase RhlE
LTYSLIERFDLNSFNELGLAAPISRALADEKYEKPTPIQAQAIPPVLAGRDLIGIAQTGTGKTAAFALPILNHLMKHNQRPERRACRVLVLSPTRELSGQIQDSFRTYGRHLRVSSALAIGGIPIGRQVRGMANGADVLVATPGRLLDLVNNNAVRLDKIEIFVLDEADRMLDMGFIRDIRKIVAKLPQKRQTLFFSATMPGEIEKLASELLNEPVRVAVTPVAKTADRVEQRIVLIERAGKGALLAEMLKSEPVDRAIVFTRTKHGADKVVRALEKSGIRAEAIHGNKSQNNRERALANFRSGKVRTLVATDIAARGIDVDGISHVVNYDIPNEPESYVHRIGRTARAGADGIAISFCDRDEMSYLRGIERLIKISIAVTDRRANPQPLSNGPREHNGNGHRNGGRKHHRHGRGNGHGHGHGNGNGRSHENGHSNGHHSGKSRHQERRNHEGRPAQGDGQRAHNPGRQGDGMNGVAFMQNKGHRPRQHRKGQVGHRHLNRPAQ